MSFIIHSRSGGLDIGMSGNCNENMSFIFIFHSKGGGLDRKAEVEASILLEAAEAVAVEQRLAIAERLSAFGAASHACELFVDPVDSKIGNV